MSSENDADESPPLPTPTPTPAATTAVPTTTANGEVKKGKKPRRKSKRKRLAAKRHLIEQAALEAKAIAEGKPSEVEAEEATSEAKRQKCVSDGGEEEEARGNSNSIYDTTHASQEHSTLYVNQIPYEVTQAELRQHFESCDTSQVRMCIDKQTGAFKGSAFVCVGDVTKGLALHQSKLGKRRINVRRQLSKEDLAVLAERPSKRNQNFERRKGLGKRAQRGSVQKHAHFQAKKGKKGTKAHRARQKKTSRPKPSPTAASS